MVGDSHATLMISSSEGSAGKACYSCSNYYRNDVRFCPRDGTDLDYAPPPLEEMARDFERRKRWPLVSIIFTMLITASAFLFDALVTTRGAVAPVGGIAVRTTPAGAIVYLDGSRVGVTPMRLSDIPTGIHEVRVVFPGYSDGRASVEILPSSTQRLVWDLTPLPSTRKRSRYLAEFVSPYLPNPFVSMIASSTLLQSIPSGKRQGLLVK